MTKSLADLLAEHTHGYDSDCGVDYGCLCADVEDYDKESFTHADHLTAVIEQYFVVTPISN